MSEQRATKEPYTDAAYYEKRPVLTFRPEEEERRKLAALVAYSGLTRSEVLRRLVRGASLEDFTTSPN